MYNNKLLIFYFLLNPVSNHTSSSIFQVVVKLPPPWSSSEMEFPDDLLAELDHLQLYNDSLFQNNFSSAYNDTDALLPTGVKVTIVVVYMIVCVIGLVGNFLVMYVIIR